MKRLGRAVDRRAEVGELLTHQESSRRSVCSRRVGPICRDSVRRVVAQERDHVGRAELDRWRLT